MLLTFVVRRAQLHQALLKARPQTPAAVALRPPPAIPATVVTTHNETLFSDRDCGTHSSGHYHLGNPTYCYNAGSEL